MDWSNPFAILWDVAVFGVGWALLISVATIVTLFTFTIVTSLVKVLTGVPLSKKKKDKDACFCGRGH